jgi:hypothetical protein
MDVNLQCKKDLKTTIMKKLFLEIGCRNNEKQNLYGKDLLFVSRLYSRFISDIKIEYLSKIAIEIVDFPNKTSIMPTHKLILVCLISEYFDFEVLNIVKTKNEKYKLILDMLINSLRKASKEFNWPKELFENAYEKALETSFVNEYELLKPKTSKCRRFLATVKANHNPDFISIFLEVTDKEHKDSPIKIDILNVVYFVDDFSEIIHGFKWINNDEIITYNKVKEINFKISLKTKNSELFLTPTINDESYLLDDLKKINPNTPLSECLEINKRRIQALGFDITQLTY